MKLNGPLVVDATNTIPVHAITFFSAFFVKRVYSKEIHFFFCETVF